jgi:hypothetical protein
LLSPPATTSAVRSPISVATDGSKNAEGLSEVTTLSPASESTIEVEEQE